MFLSSAMYAPSAKKKRKGGPSPARQGSYHDAPSDIAYVTDRVARAADFLLAHAEHFDPYTTAEQISWLTGLRDAAREESQAWSERAGQVVMRVKPPGAMGPAERAERAEARMLAREASLRSEASMAREVRRHEGSVAAADTARAHRRGSRREAKAALGALYRNPFVGAEKHPSRHVRDMYYALRNDLNRGAITSGEFNVFYRSLSDVQSKDDAVRWGNQYLKFTQGR